MGGCVVRIRVVYTERHRLHSDLYGVHPESPWRVEEARLALSQRLFSDYIDFDNAPEPDYSVVELAHSKQYVDWIRRECSRGFHYVDADTYVNEYTCDLAASFAKAAWEAALRATKGSSTLILARPGGHHAGINGKAMGAPTLGFCIFDYTSIATLELVKRGYRVAIVDFDAHHGNGSQEILWNEPMALHVDIHQWGIYPGTGWVTDVGGERARGTKINIPLQRGAGDGEFSWVLEHVVKPALELFKPDVLVVFAGFDAHAEDPLTGLEATETTYLNYGFYMGELVRGGFVSGVVAVLGGGYGRGLVRGLEAFIKGFLGLGSIRPVEAVSPGEHVESAVPTILKMLEKIR